MEKGTILAVPSILCNDCAKILTDIANKEFPGETRLQQLFGNLVLTMIIEHAEKQIKVPEWVTSSIMSRYIELEFIKSAYYKGPLCYQFLMAISPQRNYISNVVGNCIEWTRDWKSCPYEIQEVEDGTFMISIISEKKERVDGSIEESAEKKLLH